MTYLHNRLWKLYMLPAGVLPRRGRGALRRGQAAVGQQSAEAVDGVRDAIRKR
jgi:hypothetical protein